MQSLLCYKSHFCSHQNSQLLIDARAARTYRDELDALRERAIKADKLESEVGRYREQLHKMEFYKAKVEVDADSKLFPGSFWHIHFDYMLAI